MTFPNPTITRPTPHYCEPWTLRVPSFMADRLHRRYLRARGFEIAAAFEQFDFATKWRKENGIEDFYDNLDVQSYEESRKMVRWPSHSFSIFTLPLANISQSTLNGLVDAIMMGGRSTCSLSNTSPRKTWTSISERSYLALQQASNPSPMPRDMFSISTPCTTI